MHPNKTDRKRDVLIEDIWLRITSAILVDMIVDSIEATFVGFHLCRVNSLGKGLGVFAQGGGRKLFFFGRLLMS